MTIGLNTSLLSLQHMEMVNMDHLDITGTGANVSLETQVELAWNQQDPMKIAQDLELLMQSLMLQESEA